MTIWKGNSIKAPNGQKIQIFWETTKTGEFFFVKLSEITRALGYAAFNCKFSLLGLVFKNHKFTLYTKRINGGATYVADINEIVPILEAFIKLTLATRQDCMHMPIQDNARMEAERLIELFKTEVPELLNTEEFGKPSTITKETVSVEPAPADTISKTEDTQMKNNITNPTDGINLNHCPRTAAEAQASILLTELSRMGKLYFELFTSQPFSDTEGTFDYVTGLLPPDQDGGAAVYHIRSAKEQFVRMDSALKTATEFIRGELLRAINKFNSACIEIKKDTRPRDTILESEDWQRTPDGGWSRGKTTIPRDKVL